MKIIPAPDWQELLAKLVSSFPQMLQLQTSNLELAQTLRKTEKAYLPWDKFRHLPLPSEVTRELVWAYVMFQRVSNQSITPITAKNGKPFRFGLTKDQYPFLQKIDSITSGVIASDIDFPRDDEKKRYIVNGLIEEAIHSSQMEGADTSREVAKEMLRRQRLPQSRGEKMILNNYRAMKRIEELKGFELTESLLLDVHKIVTSDTLDDPAREGAFRTDGDAIHITDGATDEVLFVPPKMDMVEKELKRFFSFANGQEREPFVHPFIKACFIHFWIGYLHPFVDGNGRVARVLFYWSLLRDNYWMFQYLPISRLLKKSKVAYGKAYLYSEDRDLDLGFFVQFMMEKTSQAIDDFIEYLRRQHAEQKSVQEAYADGLNDRQVAILAKLRQKPNSAFTIDEHRNQFGLAYETARRDFIELEQKGLIKKFKVGKKFIFRMP